MADENYKRLFFAFNEYRDEHGAAAARKVLMANGSEDGTVDSVPAVRMAAAARALHVGGSKSESIEGIDTAAIYKKWNVDARKAHGSISPDSTVAATGGDDDASEFESGELDPVAIYARWNSAGKREPQS